MEEIRIREGFRGAVYGQYSTASYSTYSMPAYNVPQIQYAIEVPQCKGCGARKWNGNACRYCGGQR